MSCVCVLYQAWLNQNTWKGSDALVSAVQRTSIVLFCCQLPVAVPTAAFDNRTKCKLESQKVKDSVLAELEFVISKSRGGNQPLLVVHIICGVQHTAQT